MARTIESLKEIFQKEGDPFKDILGQEKAKRQIMSALLMNRNIAIFGPPGIGKTTIAKNIAKILPPEKVIDCGYNCSQSNPLCPKCRAGENNKTIEISGEDRFVRVQGSPDLTAEDLLGDIDPVMALKHGPMSIEAFSPGKIFKANNGVLFFDELNRCPEKLQNALLQVLEERRATLGSYDVDFSTDFIFISTMNPVDINTERLSDVLLDRFDVIYMTYPESDETERKIMIAKGKYLVEMPEQLQDLAVRFVRELRDDEHLEKVPSVRATLGLYERAQANAVLSRRKHVIYQDVMEAVESVISHRIRLKPSVKYLKDTNSYIKEEFEKFVNENYPEIEESPEKGDGR